MAQNGSLGRLIRCHANFGLRCADHTVGSVDSTPPSFRATHLIDNREGKCILREWARTLDWRQNPYDRFLLRREILHHLESAAFHEGRRNVCSFASRDEIAAEVDHLMDEFPDKYESIGVFSYVLITLPWNLAFKHGQVQHSRLAEALGKLA